MFKNSIIGYVKFFYSHEWHSGSGFVVSDDYGKKVRRLHKKELLACAIWFKNSGAINDDDFGLIEKIIEHRNSVAHELPSILPDTNKEVNLVLMQNIYELMKKVELWWLENVELGINPDMEIDHDNLNEAYSMRSVYFSLLIELARGDDRNFTEIYNILVNTKSSIVS